jgi:3-oxoacyl-[acyl-carrier protein] reductase
MTKVAIVTGASRGIGRSIAERLAHDGFSVVVNYAGNQKEAGEVVKQIESKGGKALAIKANVGNKEDVDRLFQKTLKAFRQVDVVVNNAGIMPLSLIAKEDAETFDKVIATNLRGTFLVFAQAAQHIAEGGRIIAFSSSVLAKSFSELRTVYRVKGRRRRTCAGIGERTARQKHHCERRRPWSHRYRAVSRR